jgi:uncharacterized protein
MSNKNERLHVLDGLRGLALFGILLANIRFFAGWEFANNEMKKALAGSYLEYYEWLHIILVDGKFYTIFSLLFGIGFAIQLQGLKTKGAVAAIVYLRRLAILFLIGLVHLTQFWMGDILTTYAILGLILLAFHRCSDGFILSAAAVAFVIPMIGYLIAWYGSIEMDFGLYAIGEERIASSIDGFSGNLLGVLASENWHDYFAFNQTGSFIRLGYLLESWRFVKVFFIMLVGLWVGRQIIHNELLQNTLFMTRVAFWGLLIGLPMSVAYAKLGVVSGFAGPANVTGFLRMIAYMLSVFPLGFAYAALFVLAWRKWSHLLHFFTYAGKMALSNYLLQTAICVSIFYGIGAGLVGKVEPIVFIIVAVFIFAGQVVMSKLWLQWYRYGPVEWMWRCFTYAQMQQLRKAK